MPRGSTALDSNEYDNWLASQKRTRELVERKRERASAFKRDCSGYHFNIDDKPVKIKDLAHFRQELSKRGLAIEGEFQRRPKCQ
jgi:hypothetical protein